MQVESRLHPGGFFITERALAFCGFESGCRLLDVGCGCGETVGYLCAVHHFNAMGIDLDSEKIARGKRYMGDLNIRLGDGCNLPFEANSFDGVLMECSLSRMPDRARAIRESCRVLRDGGWLIIEGLSFKGSANAQQKHEIKDCTLGNLLLVEDVEALLTEAKFDVLLREDHSSILKQFVGQLLFDFSDARHYKESCNPCEACDYFTIPCRRAQIGYFSLAAKKQERAVP